MRKQSSESAKSNIQKTTTFSNNSSIKLSNEEILTMVKAIYDEELITHINKLSSNIKSFYIEHQTIFTRIYNNLKQISSPGLTESLKKLDKCFEDFYGSAKTIFKDMKDDRNSKNEKMNLIQKENPALKYLINDNIFQLKNRKHIEINKNLNYNHRPASKTQSREIIAYATLSGTTNLKHKDNHNTMNISAGDIHSKKTMNQQIEVNQIKYDNLKKENNILKHKIELLEKKSNHDNFDLSPTSPNKLKLDSFYSNPIHNGISLNTKTTTNYTKIVNNVSNTINNIDSTLQKENNKLKDNIYTLANKVNKLITDTKYIEDDAIDETELSLYKLQIERNKENIIALITPFLNINSKELSEKRIKKGSYSYSNEKISSNSTKNIKTDPKKMEQKILKDNINNLKVQNQKITKKLHSVEKINEQLKTEINHLKGTHIQKDDNKEDKDNEQIVKLQQQITSLQKYNNDLLNTLSDKESELKKTQLDSLTKEKENNTENDKLRKNIIDLNKQITALQLKISSSQRNNSRERHHLSSLSTSMPSLVKATKPKTPGPNLSLHNNPTKTLDISIQNPIKTTVNKSADKLKINDKRQPDIKTKVIETQNCKGECKDKDINIKLKEIKLSIKKEYKDKYEGEIEKIKKLKEKEIKNYKDKNEKLQQEIDKLKKVEVVLNEKIVTLSKKFEQLKEENLKPNNDLTKISQQVIQLQSQNDSLKKEISSIQMKYQDDKLSLDSIIQNKNSEVKLLNEQLSQVNKEFNEKELTQRDKKHKLSVQDNNKENKIVKSPNHKFNETSEIVFQNEMNQLNKKNNTININSLSKYNESQNINNDTKQKDILLQQAQKKINDLEQSNLSYKNEKGKLMKDIQHLKQLNEDNEIKYKNEIEKLNLMISDKSKELIKVKSLVNELTVKSTSLDKRKHKLENELVILNSKLSEKEKQNLNYQEEITILKSKINKNEANINTLQSSSHVHPGVENKKKQSENETPRTTVNKKNSENEQKQKELQIKQHNNDTLSIKLNEVELKLNSVNKDKSKLEKQNKQYESQINLIKKTLSEKEIELGNVNKILLEKDSIIKEINNTINKTKQSLTQKEKEIKELTTKNKQIENELSTVTKNLDKNYHQLTKDLNEKQRENDSLLEQIKKLELKISESTNQIATIQVEMDTLIKKNEKEEKEKIEAAKNNDHLKTTQNKLKELESQNEEISSKLKEEIEKVQKREKDIQTFQEHLNKRMSENSELKTTIDSLKRTIDEDIHKIKKFENENKNITNDYNVLKNLSESKIQSLTSNINDLKTKIKQLIDERTELECKKDEINESLHKKIKELENKTEEFKNNINNLNIENTNLKNEKEHIKNDYNALNIEYKKEKQINQNLKNTHKEKLIQNESIIQDLTSQMNDANRLENELQKELKHLKETNNSNEKQIKDLQKEINLLQEDCDAKEKEIQLQDTELCELRREVEEAKTELAKQLEDNEKLKNGIQITKDDKEEYKNNDVQSEEQLPPLTPGNYKIEKCTQFNNLKWYLLRILNPINKDENNSIPSTNGEYDKFIWKPVFSKKLFKGFEIPPLNSSTELRKEIESLQDYQSELLDKLAKKESDYNRLNLQTVKLINKKKGDANSIQEKLIERLREDNKNLQEALQDIKKGNNVLGTNYGMSLIQEDLNNSDFLDEEHFDEILTEMTKNISTFNSRNLSITQSRYNINQLRYYFEKLLTEIPLNQAIKSILSNILRQISFTDDEIYQIISKKGGVISLQK